MLLAEHCAYLRQQLPPLNLSRPCNPAALTLPQLEAYLEFYGFLETLKDRSVDYFIGHRECLCGDRSLKIATHYWRLPAPDATVLLVHGLFDHVGLFQGLVAHLLALNCSVIAVDLPGHGLSGGERTLVQGFDEYGAVLTDTLAYFQSECHGKPVYGLGQSTGAAALMATVFARARAAQPLGLDRLVFLGPLVRPRRWPWVRRLYRLLGRRLRSVPRDFSRPNSHSQAFHDFLRNHDPLQDRALSVVWVGAMYQWVLGFSHQPTLDLPVLIVQGTADRVVDWRFNVRAIQAHFSGAQVNLIEGAMHHLANETDPWRKAIFSSISQFLRQRSRA